ncbi:ABC transporter ATP-binding protein [Streptomyces sp. 35G-GA-8]|uniref:ABC transporter ATP-binding protein n=1 Tax=Streptomyces sp. 35G-GA-8 TaxID=2939434 RepID=UPI00201EBE25|nr:ABC transporter ATP-binding protein [Streptomyces sp. 35G-GA-8]MCL7382423.1 ABC transporter ATP-binding protein [Streptomyces sp. 35G-GA-8]
MTDRTFVREAKESHIHVEGLWRRYGSGKGSFDAVRGISFTVMPGELFALLGTNGAGKTSTVELLEGLAPPHQGTIRIFGSCDPVADRQQIRPRVGVMLQEGGFISHLTVKETVQLWAEITTGPRPTAEALELTGLTHRAGVMVQNLSGGEKRRLSLATATLSQPEILFLDEPTAGMDAEGRHATWQLIKNLREQGATILLTTHYLEEAESLADHLAIMHQGKSQPRVPSPTSSKNTHPRTPLHPVVRPEPGTHDARPSRRRRGPGRKRTDRHHHTQNLQKDAARILSWAEDQGAVLDRFTARPASLEEAFITIASDENISQQGTVT